VKGVESGNMSGDIGGRVLPQAGKLGGTGCQGRGVQTNEQ